MLEHPDISRALSTGYCGEVEYHTVDKLVYHTDDGEMYEEDAIAYMIGYVKSNPTDAAEAFGIDWSVRSVLCDAYGEPYE